jgi:hypothetical protein
MTLVAFTLRPDGADIVTDSLSYGPEMTAVEEIDKCRVIDSWDTAIMSTGPSRLGDSWSSAVRDALPQLRDFDELEQHTPPALCLLWLHLREEGYLRKPGRADEEDGHVFHVGWSPRRGRFAAVGFSSEDGFQPIDLTEHELFVKPHPHTPTPATPPTTDQEWAQLVTTAHQDWNMPGPYNPLRFRIWMAGDVVRTTLGRGHAERRVIARIPTRGRDWRWMNIGQMSVEGQLGPCACGSGLPAACCHLPNNYGKPCPCGSDKTVGDCHAIRPEDPRVMAYYLAHLDDYERTRPALADAYRRALPHLNWPPPDILRLRGWKDAAAARPRRRRDRVSP